MMKTEKEAMPGFTPTEMCAVWACEGTINKINAALTVLEAAGMKPGVVGSMGEDAYTILEKARYQAAQRRLKLMLKEEAAS